MALARALAIEPRMLLLDEPFGALDAQVRRDLRRWLREVHDRAGVTTVFVTHDQEEALDLADRVAILRDGELIQLGTPQELYDDPANAFVYDFLGRRLPAAGRGGGRASERRRLGDARADGRAERPTSTSTSAPTRSSSRRPTAPDWRPQVRGVGGARPADLRIDCRGRGRAAGAAGARRGRRRPASRSASRSASAPTRFKLYPRSAGTGATSP